MRLALISDIHANCVALEAVLTSLATQQITHLICLGDVASTGPQPQEVIARLQEIGCPVVMGNMDAWLLQPQIKKKGILLQQNWQDIDLWCAQQLSSTVLECLILHGGRVIGRRQKHSNFSTNILLAQVVEEAR